MNKPKIAAMRALSTLRGRGRRIAAFQRKTIQRAIQPFVRHGARTHVQRRFEALRGIGMRTISKPSRSSCSSSRDAGFVGRAMIVTS